MLPTIGGSVVGEHRLCAFGVRGCSHSAQAAAHLPLRLDAVRQTADEAGAPPEQVTNSIPDCRVSAH